MTVFLPRAPRAPFSPVRVRSPGTRWRPAIGCALLLAATLAVGACNHTVGSDEPVAAADVVNGFGALTYFSFAPTGKLASDHILSWATGRDCSVLSLEQTGVLCPAKVNLVEPDVYCYRTLAGVDCHRHPDPYRNGHQALASPRPERVIRKDAWYVWQPGS